jgi:A/G-specific adenine glycosylase
LNEVAERLIDWYRRGHRDLPWRRARDPYAIWVSEVMLQQTQVKTVLPYFARWMQRFPTVSALAAASEDEVLHAWQGLGYYSRAKSLLRGARAVVERHAGELPRRIELLRELPGIGPYSAGAIASIAFGLPQPVVDGNVKRVLCRLHALRGDPGRAPLARKLWRIAAELVPQDAASDFNQALMELGATLCTPKHPRCEACPLSERCAARAKGLVDSLPESPSRRKSTKLHMVAALVFRGTRVLAAKLPDDAPRWAGMWHFPATEVGPRETPEAAVRRAAREICGIDVEVQEKSAVVRHGVTRYRITLDAYRCRAPRGRPRALGASAVRWVSPPALGALALPSAHRKLADRLLEPA